MNALRCVLSIASYLLAAVLFSLAVGCGQRDEIASYEVLKPEVVDPTLVSKPSNSPQTVQQTLGLILPAGEVSWFFKLTGPQDAVAPLEPSFLEFAKSIKLPKETGAEPTWTLPAGWQQLPGSQFRYATLRISDSTGAGKSQEISVSQAGGDMLANVNRWRGQLNLPPVSSSDLETTSQKLDIDGREGIYVSLVGTGSGGMSGTPFAPFAGGKLPPDHPPIGPAQNTNEARK